VLVDASLQTRRQRIYFHGIKEMPAGYDAEVAELFRDLRVASNLTETDLAARIATPIEVVKALEQGAIYALPPWPETCRVVNAYGTLLNLDTRPLLRRIYAQLEAGIVELRPKTMPDVPVMPPQAGGDAMFGGNSSHAPQPPAMPQAPVWPNGQQQPAPQAQPRAPQPKAPQPPQPQAKPQAPQAPQPQAPWPGGAPQFPQGNFGGGVSYAPQPAQGQPSAYSSDPGAYRQPSQPYPPEGYPPEAYTPEAYPPEGYPSEPASAAQEDASFMGEAEFEPEPETVAEPKQKKPALLKWGIGALVAGVVLVGLWMALGDSSSDPGASSGPNASDPVLDPDDPRSRKADKLPNNF
jgi:hypothetical protein